MDARTQEYAENLKTDADRSGKAIVVEDNKTCGITAYFSSEGNIRRQPGSVLKTLAVYAPAMEENMISPCTPIADEKTDFGGYSPSNYKDEYHGFVSVRRALSESMKSAIISILTVGGFVVIFGMAADAMYNTGLITALAKPLSRLMPGGSLPLAEGFLIGLAEVTRGAAYIAGAGVDVYSALPCLSFILAFGGLSIILQSLSFLSACGISAGKFLRMKFTQSFIALLFAQLFAIVITAAL